MKCLLVDDVEDNLLVLASLLGDQDLELLSARSGKEALELLLEHEVGLALVDVQMPEMDGFELAELMRGSLRTRDVPIIFVTAGSRDQHRVFKGYEMGAVDFLFKPIETHVLQSKVGVFRQLYRQRQLLAEQLHHRTEALRTNEMFMAILSHDLRNPLNAIMTGSELLLRSKGDEAVHKVARRMRSSGERMTDMIEKMLDLARSRVGGGIAIAVEPVELAELVHRVAGEHQAQDAKSRLEFVELGELRGSWDPGRLAQVVSNLLGNALAHGHPTEPIQIRLDGTDADQVVLSVSNAGSIPVATRARLFDPFRSRDTGGPSERGLGLGLYIVQQIALAHGGRVEAKTDDPERTTFIVTIPRLATSRA